MNRFTRELRKRDYKINSDFEYLPYNGLDHVEVHADHHHVHQGRGTARQLRGRRKPEFLKLAYLADSVPKMGHYFYALMLSHRVRHLDEDQKITRLLRTIFGISSYPHYAQGDHELSTELSTGVIHKSYPQCSIEIEQLSTIWGKLST